MAMFGRERKELSGEKLMASHVSIWWKTSKGRHPSSQFARSSSYIAGYSLCPFKVLTPMLIMDEKHIHDESIESSRGVSAVVFDETWWRLEGRIM